MTYKKLTRAQVAALNEKASVPQNVGADFQTAEQQLKAYMAKKPKKTK